MCELDWFGLICQREEALERVASLERNLNRVVCENQRIIQDWRSAEAALAERDRKIDDLQARVKELGT